jgi:hypothetical protein
MPEEILTVVRLLLADLSDEIKRRHKLAETLVDSRIEGDALVMYFSRTPHGTLPNLPVGSGAEISRRVMSEATETLGGKRKRRAKGKRNRMRTRGWQVVGRIVNSRGQPGLVYKPFVDALSGKHLTPSQQKAVVTQILRSNGNRPSAASIEYYWMNTVEYLRKGTPEGEATSSAG